MHDSWVCKHVMILFQSCLPFYRNCWRTSTKRSSNWRQFMLACYSAKMRSYIFSRSRCLPERYVYYPCSRYSFFPASSFLLSPSLSSWPCRLIISHVLYFPITLQNASNANHVYVPLGIYRVDEIIFVYNSYRFCTCIIQLYPLIICDC